MLFNSFAFICFLPIVFILYWYVFKTRRWQNFLIVIASYIFYGWWNWRFLLLIAFTSFCSFINGLLISKYEGKRNIQKVISASNIIINLLILSIFKYYHFFVDNLDVLLSNLGYHIDWVTMNIVLPVGISFYTFQALSYTIDIYQKKIKPTTNIIDFFAYISFFPQLVAGPIERATNLLPQFQIKRTFDYTKATDGCRQMLWGFFKKIVIADNCATIVNANWEHYQDIGGITLLIIGILFTFQIYCDFSGYSDIAIGCARLFGFNLMRNFNYPYFSRNIPEFWRRWHISLMTWFRDYIYFPLGGSHSSKLKTIRNIFIVWGISGLWHGANWTFVFWGLYHATLLAIYNALGINTKYKHEAAHGKQIPNIKEFVQIIITFFLTIIGWIIFRAESLKQAANYIYSMFTNYSFDPNKLYGKTIILCLTMTFIEWMQRDKQHPLQFPDNKLFNHRTVRWGIYYFIILSIIMFAGKNQTFIYFQF